MLPRQKGNGERDIGKRKLQENSKRKELKKKITTGWRKPTFWTQEPARMTDGLTTTDLLMCPQHLYLGVLDTNHHVRYPMYVPVVQLGLGRGPAQGGRTPGTAKAAGSGASVHSHVEALRG